MLLPAFPRFVLVAAVSAMFGLPVYAQTEHDFIGPDPASTGTNSYWTREVNWADQIVPNDAQALIRIGELADPGQDRANIPFNDYTNGINVSAFMVLPELNTTASTFAVRNYNSAAGLLRIHGHEMTINGTPVTLLAGVFGASQDFRFEPANGGMVIELNTSGVFHNDGTGTFRSSTEIIDAPGGSYSITKTGAGILRLDRRNATHGSTNSTYSGGFILQEGIVEFTFSGGSSANPFGTGPLTLHGGTIRSTSDTGRTVYNNIILDGSVTLGSSIPGFTGNIGISSVSGNRSTTLASDSTIEVVSTATWHQDISGDYGLVKSGDGVLTFSGAGGNAEHTGPTTVAAGTLILNNHLTASSAEVLDGATLTGVGTFASSLTVRSGGTLAPVTGLDYAEEPAQMTVGGLLTVEAGAFLAYTIKEVDSDSLLVMDGVNLGEGLGDVILAVSLEFQPEVNDVFVLIDNQGGNPLLGSFAFDGTTVGEGSLIEVVTGDFSQVFSATYLHEGNSFALVAIPEPAAAAALAGLVIFGIVLLRRRRA